MSLTNPARKKEDQRNLLKTMGYNKMTPIILALLLLISSASAIDINVNVSAEGNGYSVSEEGSWSCIVTDPPAPEMALSVTGPAEMYWNVPANLTANVTNIGECNLENISAGLEGKDKSDYVGIIEPGDSAEIEIPVVVTGTMATETLRPTADGYTGAGNWIAEDYDYDLDEQPTPLFGHVDEAVLDYDDYLQPDMPNSWVFFELANPSVIQSGDTINNVTVRGVLSANDDPEDPNIGKYGVYVGSTIYESSAFDLDYEEEFDGDYETKSIVWATNPATGVAWTLSDLQSLQIGMYVQEATGALYLCQFYADVDFTAASAGTPMYAYLQQ